MGLNWVSRSFCSCCICSQIPTHSVVHRDFGGEFPGVLRVNAALFAVKPLNVIVPDTCAIQLAKSEAGESVSEAGAIWEIFPG